MLHLPCLKLSHALCVLQFLCAVDNARNLFLLQAYLSFQIPALLVCTIKRLHRDSCRFGHLVAQIRVESVCTLGRPFQEWCKSSQIAQISTVPGLMTCCAMTTVLNLCIELKLQTFTESNWHIHRNYSACGSTMLNPKPTHLMTSLTSVLTLSTSKCSSNFSQLLPLSWLLSSI